MEKGTLETESGDLFIWKDEKLRSLECLMNVVNMHYRILGVGRKCVPYFLYIQHTLSLHP
jgi:hypothetical protein